MRQLQCEAILLRSVDVGEADRIVHFLTPVSGRLAAMAKSARKSIKRFPGTLDLLNHLRVDLHQRPGRMAFVDRAVLVSPFLGLRADPVRFALGSYLIELIGRLAPEGAPPRDARQLFDFTLETLRAVERAAEADAKLRIFVELAALGALGLRPELCACVRCGEALEGSARLGFHVAEGGVVCLGCQGRGQLDALVPVHLGTLRALERGISLDLGALDRLALGAAELSEATTLVERFHRFHVGIELRSEGYLRETLAGQSSGVARSAARGNTRALR